MTFNDVLGLWFGSSLDQPIRGFVSAFDPLISSLFFLPPVVIISLLLFSWPDFLRYCSMKLLRWVSVDFDSVLHDEFLEITLYLSAVITALFYSNLTANLIA